MNAFPVNILCKCAGISLVSNSSVTTKHYKPYTSNLIQSKKRNKLMLIRFVFSTSNENMQYTYLLLNIYKVKSFTKLNGYF